MLAASGARIYFVHEQATSPDFTYRFAMTMLCAVIENHLAIIVACAPSIKVILLHIFPGLEAKFEKLVSKGSSGSQDESEFSIGTIAALDVEMGMNRNAGKVGLGFGRPVSMRTTTDESESGRSERRTRKWWRAPSSWEVNNAGGLEDTGGLAR